MTPQKISAHRQIQQVLYRYCRGIDWGDAELVRSTCHPNAVDRPGPFGNGPGLEFADLIVEDIKRCPSTGQLHTTGTVPEGWVASVAGRCLDRFAQRDGDGKIADRRVVLDWSQPAFPNICRWLGEKSAGGQKGRQDLSFAFFQESRPAKSGR